MTSPWTVLVFMHEAISAFWQHQGGVGSEGEIYPVRFPAVPGCLCLCWLQKPRGCSRRMFNLVPRWGVLRAFILSPA